MPNARAVPPLRVFVDDLNPEDFFSAPRPLDEPADRLQIDPLAAAERIFTRMTERMAYIEPTPRRKRKPWRAAKPLPLP